MNQKDLVDEWLEIARDAFETAKFLLDKKRPIPVEIVCFHAQQAAEKALKAVLQMAGSGVPRTHDLVDLARQCDRFRLPATEFIAACSELSVYGVTSRYPGRPGLDETDARRALVAAELVMLECDKALSKN